MENLDILEAATGGPFVLRHKGMLYPLLGPAQMHYQRVLACLQEGHHPFLPGNMPEWKRALAFQRWSAHYGLPDFGSAQRLAYLVDRYRSELTYDLRQFGVDLGDLWRSRQWRTLLDLIDHLPSHSWYSAAVAEDEEHAELLRKAMAERGGDERSSKPKGPPLTTWTPEVATMTEVLDAVRFLTYVTAAAGGSQSAKPPPPAPRPHSLLADAMKRSEFDRRQEKHNALAARLLPHKRPKGPEETR